MTRAALIGALLGVLTMLLLAWLNMAPPLIDRWAGRNGAFCVMRSPRCEVILFSAWPSMPPGVPVVCRVEGKGWRCEVPGLDSAAPHGSGYSPGPPR